MFPNQRKTRLLEKFVIFRGMAVDYHRGQSVLTVYLDSRK